LLAELQEVLVSCCTARDPAAALAAARVAHPGLERWLATIDPDGLRLTAMLIQKLRFERIVRGDPELAARFEADPPGFTSVFREYLVAQPPTCVFPEEEADRFRRFLDRSGSAETGP
jgi:hypothetical protein